MKWKFATCSKGVIKQFIRDNDIEVFTKRRYESVIRESIQNSLDAVLNDKEPVVVDFEFDTISKDKHPGIFSVEKHLQACLNEDTKEDDRDLIERMLDEVSANTLETLTISDYNTKGMEVNSTYDSFAFRRNDSNKGSASSAGSKGMGKAAYFAATPLRSIMVSSRFYKNKAFLFQGIARLSYHKMDNEELYHMGFYGDGLDVVDDETRVDEMFHRSESGTSILILGLWNDKDRIEKMIKALLNSFWLAIYDNQLIVKIDGIEFKRDNLEEKMLHYFPEVKESGQYNEHGNPRPYFETYTGKSKISKYYKSKEILPVLGSLELYLSKNTDYPALISFFRKSKMLIYKQRYLYENYCGVLVCNDSEGNKVLKRMEDAEHKEWSPKNWKDPRAIEAKEELRQFIEECKKDFIGSDETDEITLPGLSDLISMNLGKSSQKEGNTVERKKKDIITKTKPTEPKNRPKPPIKDVLIYSLPSTKFVKYAVILNSMKPIAEFEFQLIAGSDNDSLTKDNELKIISSSKGEMKDNKVILNVEKGFNRFEITVDDTEKRAIFLKQTN